MKKFAVVLLALTLVVVSAGCGEKPLAEAELRAMMEAEVTQPILDFKYDDYGGDGAFEAFAFVGEKPDEGDGHAGEIWFVSADGAERLEASPHGTYWGLLDVLTFGGRKFVKAETYYTTGGASNLWSVREGKPHCEAVPGSGGFLVQIDDNSFTLEHSALDAIYTDGMLMARTWKPYWFFWDGESFKEYGGVKITEEQLRKCGGASEVLDGIYGIVGDIFYRGNGIINVNHTVLQSEGDIRNEYITLQLDGTEISIDETYENFGGIYLPALAPDIAVYPELPGIFN